MALILPASIENDTPADAAELQSNFSAIQTHINSNMIARDGSVAMTQPLLLVGDPTLPNHAANKGYVDTVDSGKVAKAGDVMTGALIAGNARMFTRTDTPTEGAFSHKDATHSSHGFVVRPTGSHSVINAAGQTFTVYNRQADADAYDVRFTVAPTGTTTNGEARVNGSLVADAPTALTLYSTTNAQPYLAFAHGATRYGYIQAAGTSGVMYIATDPDWQIILKPGGNDRLIVRSDGVQANTRLYSYYTPTDGTWVTSNIHAHNSGTHGARISFYHPDIACQLRYGPTGDILELVNATSTAYTRFMCYTVTQVSSADTKRDIRSLRQHRKVAAVKQRSADSDTVDQPDVMALRPIIYRPKDEPTKMVVDKEGQPTGKTQPWSRREVFGREARREVLGLVADEVQHVIPSAVTHAPDGKPLGIDYSQVTVALLDHVQTLTEKVAALEARLEALS